MIQETMVITEEKIHPEAVAMRTGYRLSYIGARFTQDELVALVEREQPVAILCRYGKINERVLARLSQTESHWSTWRRDGRDRPGRCPAAWNRSNNSPVPLSTTGMTKHRRYNRGFGMRLYQQS